ncbi:MAG: hypothetical protein EWM47_12140 [Anaerolineaceae bacterium]|nr:MAG: hypothetical protein EWM47_12140 [Anaerolineaceae bacterium]
MEEKDKLYLHINVVMDRDTDKQEYFWNKISSYLESMGMECLGSSEYQPVERIPEIKKLKCMNSQKTKDELWNRLWKEFGQLVYMEGMNEHVKMGANGDLVDFISQELDKAKIEVLTEIFQTCYQEDSKTRELVEEKLSKLKDKK